MKKPTFIPRMTAAAAASAAINPLLGMTAKAAGTARPASTAADTPFFSQGWFLPLSVLAGIIIIAALITLILHIGNRSRSRNDDQNRLLFHQTAISLINAIDAKDSFTRGHSARVADYSRKLAEMSGKSEKECDRIYYAALLHDVGMLGVPDSIVGKKGKLTDEEYALIKQHPAQGAKMLAGITEFPDIAVGARYHHERFDGRGYPDGLIGAQIPEAARIIAVADAYDAMSSKRSYRDRIPQQKVREEIVKGSGTQFDPNYALLMLHLIDEDLEYEMSEHAEVREYNENNEIVIGGYRSRVSEGIIADAYMTVITMSITSDDEASGSRPAPSLILFDSHDGKVHTGEKEIKDLGYYEYGEITSDLRPINRGARKIVSQRKNEGAPEIKKKGDYRIDAVRIRDHALIRISGRRRCAEFIIALPDSTRFLYLGFTGEHCRFTDIVTVRAQRETSPDYIPRIAEEISYISGPAGDIPNIQADGYRTAHSGGIEIKDGLTLSLHAMSLPTARLVWHCPYIDLFCSDNGQVGGENYRDLAFIRFDGEYWVTDPGCTVEPDAVKSDDFMGWEAWKQFNRRGYDAEVTFRVSDGRITVITENAGISVRHTVVLTDITAPVYAALTGDQVAVTNIRTHFPPEN